ncbi:hypothetical protein EJ08DRAFT_702864 [Tothia fuscella]|uniref:Uncharacterized protein n=1 Tax=Tothia fuscella TaxID=1048955 RepID=A0A9P4TTE8_9PEZI|nr:hypothetical protein EJ08DRAFT_702864 [Tothia fuscella]
MLSCTKTLAILLFCGVSVLAAPQRIAPRDDTVGILFCAAAGFKDCTPLAIPNAQCYNLPSGLDNEVSSFKMPKHVGCNFFANDDCHGYSEWTTGADKDMRNIFGQQARNDFWSSIVCYTTA